MPERFLSLPDCLFSGSLRQFSTFEITTSLPSISEAEQEVQERWEGLSWHSYVTIFTHLIPEQGGKGLQCSFYFEISNSQPKAINVKFEGSNQNLS